MRALVYAARRSFAASPSRISCVRRLAAVSASWVAIGVGVVVGFAAGLPLARFADR